MKWERGASLLSDVDLELLFLVFNRELEDQEGVSGLALPQGRVKSHRKEHVSLVRFLEQKEVGDGVVFQLVVMGLAVETQNSREQLNIQATTKNMNQTGCL